MFPESLPMSGPEESFVTELPPMQGPVCLQMLMSHVVSPSEFYVHLVTPDAGVLDVMMDELNKFYDSTLIYSLLFPIIPRLFICYFLKSPLRFFSLFMVHR